MEVDGQRQTPTTLPLGKRTGGTHLKKAGSGRVQTISPPQGSSDLAARNDSLYQVRYSGPVFIKNAF